MSYILYNEFGDFMTLYIDLIIILNILVNYIFIKTIKIVYKEGFTILQIIISSLLLALSFTLFFVPIKYIYNLRYFVGIIIGICAFYKNNIKTLIIQICVFYILNISFIGSLVIFNVNSNILLIICSLLISVLWFIDSFKKDRSIQTNYKIKINDKVYIGYLDTGNRSCCDNIPIVYLDIKELNQDYLFYKTVKVFTINGYSNIDIYNGPLLYIKKTNYVVYYAFIKSLGKKVILNKELGE